MTNVTIKLRYVRHSAKKLRPYARFFSGKPLVNSIEKSSLMSQDSARFIHKALLMAQDAATHKELSPAELTISEITATEGPRIKRVRPNSRGRANSYQKLLAHLTVTVAPGVPKKVKSKPAKVAVKKEEGKN